ncbi:unnamed protein product, partial [Ixodes pacificus]
GNFATACQGKAWAFERVLGLELVPTLYDKSFAHVQSRRDCEEYCLNEQTFDCRSAVYFDDTAECRLSRHDRRTQPDGVIKSSNPRINYLENQCLEVSPTCPYEKTADAYPVYTDVVQMTGIISEQSCESFCTTYPNFNCRSFAYYPSNGQCFISGEDRVSAGPASTNSRPGILFYERSCKDGVGGTGTTDGGSGTTSPGGGSSTGGGHSPTNSPTFPTAQPPQTPTLFPPTGNQESIPRTSLHRQGSQSLIRFELDFSHVATSSCRVCSRRFLPKALVFRENGGPGAARGESQGSDAVHQPPRLRAAVLRRAALPVQGGQLRREPPGVSPLFGRQKLSLCPSHLRQGSLLLGEPMCSQ